jgi:hypothetical protein
MSPLSSRSKNKPSRQQEGKYVTSSIFTLVSCWASSSTLKMEEVYSSETSIDFDRTTQLFTPEDSTFHNYLCENLKL